MATDPSLVRAWLAWYSDMGADEPIGDQPQNRFVAAARAQARADGAAPSSGDGCKAPSPGTAPVPRAPSPARPALRSAQSIVQDARAVAAACASLAELEAALSTFDGCSLKDTATSLCFADGAEDAPVILIGEAPGAEEDRRGKPFVGPSGQLLDRMLAAIGLDRRGVWITNLIFWRPPGNRPPTAAEIAVCQPFLERQIELLRPRLIVFLGGAAARALLGLEEGVSKLRGRRFTYATPDAAQIPALVIFHPAYLLRQPAHKRLAWRDLLAIRRLLARETEGERGDTLVNRD